MADLGVGQEVTVKTRKRKRNQASWKQNSWKKLRNSGEEYVSSSGKIVAKRTTGCDCNCPLCCFERTTAVERQNT